MGGEHRANATSVGSNARGCVDYRLRVRQVSGDEHLVLRDGVHARTVAARGSTRRLNRRPFEKRLEQRR
jgi:hypothetical protein